VDGLSPGTYKRLDPCSGESCADVTDISRDLDSAREGQWLYTSRWS